MSYFALDDPVTASAAGQSHILLVVDKSLITNPLSGRWTINLIGWHVSVPASGLTRLRV